MTPTHLLRILEGVRTLAGGAGEIDKKADPKLSHISDALAYYVDFRFPIAKLHGSQGEVFL